MSGLVPFDAESDDEIQEPRRDEDGQLYEDFGFMERAHRHKGAGNEEFKKGRYAKALQVYDSALEVLSATLQDSSITLSEKKKTERAILNSTLHLNKSACYCKLKNWHQALVEAAASLSGEDLEEIRYSDPYLGGKVEHSRRQRGYVTVAYVERRLPRSFAAKAWFRMAKCHAQMGFPVRARQVLLKAREVCDDEKLLAQISMLWKQAGLLKKRQREKQQQQFEGYFDKLGDRGGYMTARVTKKSTRRSDLTYEQRVRQLEKLDDSAGDEDDEEFQGSSEAPGEGQAAALLLLGKDPRGGEAQALGQDFDEVEEAPVEEEALTQEQVWEIRQREMDARVTAWNQQYWQKREDQVDPEERRRQRAAARSQQKKPVYILLDSSEDEDGGGGAE